MTANHPLVSRARTAPLSCLAVALAAGATAFGEADLSFTNVTLDAGIDVVHTPLTGTPGGNMTPGAAAGDFDGDGWTDLFVLGGGATPDRLYMNDGDGTFTDRAAAWGVDAGHRGFGVAVGDYDGDGDLDVYVTSLGTSGAGYGIGRHKLYRNDGGGFTEVAAAAGVTTTSTIFSDGFGAAWGDYDLDGDLDLMVCGWWLDNGGNTLFRNEGDGTFTEVTETALGAGVESMRGFAPRFVDVNGDRYPELLVAADFGTSRYYVNAGDGTFLDMTAASGTGLDGNGMGQAIGDFDRDGLLDWYVTSIYTVDQASSGVPGTGNMLYMGAGVDTFVESSIDAGVNDGGWGWATDAVDFDHDGWEDLIETNGWLHPSYDGEFVGEPTYLFMNAGDGTFVERHAEAGLVETGQGRGIVAFDADNDGDRDVLITCYGEPATLHRNDLTGDGIQWLRVFLDTSAAPALAPNGYGTRIEIEVAGQTQQRWLSGGNTYLSQSELSAHFGLGAADLVDRVTVHWNDGTTTELTDVAASQTITVSAPAPICPGDADGDDTVDLNDLNFVLANWGTTVDPGTNGDVDGNGTIDLGDLNTVLGNWGQSCG